MRDQSYRWISPFHARGLGSQSFARAIIGKPLTDRTIARYEKLGRYTAEYREARRRKMAEKGGKLTRQGAFVELEPGRLLYSPL